MRNLLQLNINKSNDIIFYINLVLFTIGFFLNIFAYLSFYPIFIFFIYFIIGRILMKLFSIGGFYEIKMYNRVSLIGLIMSGLSAIYVAYFNDFFQIYSDAGNFYDLSSNNNFSLITLNEIQDYFENALPLFIWNSIYNFFSFIGFPREQYVGILFNVIIVAFSGVLSIKISKIIYLNNHNKLNRLITLFSFCGLFWLFASIHLRDSLVLFSVTLLTWFWVVFLKNKLSLISLILIILINAVSFFIFRFLRSEFTFVPIAFFIAAFISKQLTQKKNYNSS